MAGTRKHHRPRVSRCRAAIILAVSPFVTATPAHPATIGDLIAEVLEQNPQLQAMAYAVRAAGERTKPVSLWPDPVFSASLMNVGFGKWNVGTMDMAEASLQVMQEIPIRNKLGYEHEVALQEVQLASAMRDELANSLAAQVALAALDIYELDETLVIQARGRDLYSQMVHAAEGRLVGGGVMQADVMALRLELEMAEASLRETRARRAALVARLNGLLNRAGGTAIDRIFPGEFPVLPADTTRLIAEAIDRHPMLARARVLQRQSHLMQRLARANLVPNPMVMARYGNRGRMDGLYEVGVSMPIPLRMEGRQRAVVREAGEMARMRDRELASGELEVRTMVSENAARIEAAALMLDSYRSILLPRARQVIESSSAAYITGMSSLEQRLAAARGLNRMEQEALSSEMMVRRMLVEFEASRGTLAEVGRNTSQRVR